MWKTVLTVLEAISLAHMIVTGQAEIVVHVKVGANVFYRNVVFSQSTFTGFHECMCRGETTCSVKFSLDNCPNTCLVVDVTPDNSGQNYTPQNKYYNCTTSAANRSNSFICQNLRPTPMPPPAASHIQTHRLVNSACPSTCVGFVWNDPAENITFPADDQLNVDICDANCLCPVQPKGQSSTTIVASLSTSSTMSSPPIGIIVGAVVGVIAVIVIIIIIVVVCKRRRAIAKSSEHADHNTSATSSNGAGVNSKTNDGTSHSYYNNEFSDNLGEFQTANTGANNISGYHDTLHQPNITKNGEAPVKHPPKPQFTIKDNDSDFGYSTAQMVVPEDNNNTKSKKTHDNYDYVAVEDDAGVTDPKPEATRAKNPAVNPPKVKDDYAVVDKTRKTDLEQDFDNDCSRASDGYSTAGNVNQAKPNNDDPNATSVYSKLHQEVRDIKNPYNVGPNTNDVYTKLHEEEVRDIKNPYNVLPEQQGASDTNSILPDTAHNAHDTKAAKPSKSLPYGKEDYAVVVKTKSTNKPTQASFQLRNDEN